MSFARGRVLLADDEPGVLDYLGRGLRKVGFFVEPARNGSEAASAFRSKDFDVLLSDINMPGNSQLELLNAIRDEQRLLPVVLMTGQPTVDSAVGAFRLGVVDYITKPFELDALVLLLDEAIRKGRALVALREAKDRAEALSASVASLEYSVNLPNAGAAPARPRAMEDRSRGEGVALDPLAQLTPDELARLSAREREVTRLLALGTPISGVAVALERSPHTVRSHVKNVFVKLRVHSQIALLSKLAGHGKS